MEQFLIEAPNWYFYSMIPYLLLTFFLLWGGIVEKDIDLWQYGGLTLFIGITPFNWFILIVCSVFLIAAIFIGLLSAIGTLIFYIITKHYEKV